MLSFQDDTSDEDSSPDDDSDDDSPGDDDPVPSDDNDSDKGESGQNYRVMFNGLKVYFITLINIGQKRE